MRPEPGEDKLNDALQKRQLLAGGIPANNRSIFERNFELNLQFTRQQCLNRLLILYFLALMSLMWNMSATALEIKDGNRVSYPEGSFLDDDLFITGASCRLDGTINGDVLAFGQDVRNTGIITGVFIAMGNGVTHTGEVRHSLGVCGKVIFLDGTVSGTSYAVGETLEIGTEANLKRELYASCKYFILDGEIGADADISCKAAVISGVVGGNLELKADEVEIRETATINGDLIVYCEEQDLFIDDDALITGEVVRRDPERIRPGFLKKLFLFSRLYFLSALLMIGLLVIVLAHKHVRRAASAITTEPLRSAAVGILTFVGGFILVVALSITVIGIPAALLVSLVLCSLMVFVGQAYLVTALGALTLGRQKIDSIGGTIIGFLLGLVVLSALLFVPIAGPLVYLLAGLIGAGGFVSGLKMGKAPVAFPISAAPPVPPAPPAPPVSPPPGS